MFFFSTILAYLYIITPIEPIRLEPNSRAPVINEAIFAEEVQLLEKREKWTKIQTLCDGEQGWIREGALCERETPYADCSCIVPIIEVQALSAAIYANRETRVPIMYLPWECRLEAEDPYVDGPLVKIRFPDRTEAFIQKKDVTADLRALTKTEMAAFSRNFLSVSYSKSGRSSFGFNNARFMQMLYRQMGQFLPGSAEQQYQWSEFEPVSLEALEPGDLIFWGRSEKEIAHVGMFMGEGRFIHMANREARPQLKISALDDPLYKGTGEWSFRAGRRIK